VYLGSSNLWILSQDCCDMVVGKSKSIATVYGAGVLGDMRLDITHIRWCPEASLP